MLESIKYVNSINKVIEFGKMPYFANENELRNFKWDYSSVNGRITSFSKGIVEKDLKVVIYSTKESEAYNARNELFETLEYDVINNVRGKLYIGNYYLNCNLVASDKENYTPSKRRCDLDLTIVTDTPYWFLERSFNFRSSSYGSEADQLDYGVFNDFPVSFPMDFQNSMIVNELINPNFIDSNFELRIYGACENPSVNINDNIYRVYTTLLYGEYLVINSKEKKIYKVESDGTIVNEFNNRDRDNYIFTKVPTGTCKVTYENVSAFDITLYEERSEPKWI
ncbi:MAG: hypothetical protein ACI4D0_03435 [Lachnospira sp.]